MDPPSLPPEDSSIYADNEEMLNKDKIGYEIEVNDNRDSEVKVEDSATVSSKNTQCFDNYFVERCTCEVGEKIEKFDIIVKEATTGYFDPNTQQSIGNFVTYVIEFENIKIRRRYSEFELLASHLNRTYPYYVIPPIPEKESLTSILSTYTGLKGKHDPFLIQHRIRLFQSFLRYLKNHPGLSGDHFFHSFISSEADWSDGITLIGSKLPFTHVNVNANTTASSSVNASASTSMANRKCKVPDLMITKMEEMTKKYQMGVKSIEKGQQKLLKRLKEESNVLCELGASFNAFSLEYPGLHDKLELIGQSADSEVIDLHSLIRHHELLSDSLKEIGLFSDSIMKTLQNWTGKRVELEDFHDEINGRKNILMQMESIGERGEEGKIKKVRQSIEELENSRKNRLAEMNEFTIKVSNDINRTYEYFGNTWLMALKTLAECQCKWHESAVISWSAEATLMSDNNNNNNF